MLKYKLRNDLSVNTSDNKSLAVETINKTSKNVIVHVIYRPPYGKMKPFKNHLKNVLLKNKTTSKIMHLMDDLRKKQKSKKFL